ncbi:MAG: BamA/TamA family outer membrane protein [SAR324 cluster bacterium]|nr:BamA/TamA family outer membrane protein [SAR324 cluster bacterium]
MDTEPDDYSIIELKDLQFNGARMALTFLERRFEMYGLGYSNTSTLDTIRDNQGELVIDAKGADPQTSRSWTAGALVDLTDDRLDPRIGLRIDISQSRSPPQNSDSPDYFVEEQNVTAYIPVGDVSTWVFNYFQSDAVVVRKGETDRDVIAEELGLDCNSLSGTAQSECLNVIDDVVAGREFGSSTSLGGRSRLRSFPQGRYNGAHTAFHGTEFRWNLTDESTPFDLYFIQDIRTGIQLAFFYEEGSIADKKDEVWKEKRSSAGIGFRLVTGSGLIYRIDYATGEEGGALTAIVNYPWDSF